MRTATALLVMDYQNDIIPMTGAKAATTTRPDRQRPVTVRPRPTAGPTATPSRPDAWHVPVPP